MSLNQFVTSANSIESLYITRQEVIQAFSTIIQDLSGLSTISFGTSPNPSFSTITLPPGGLIGGFAPIQTSNVIFQTGTGLGTAYKLTLGNVGSAVKQAITASDTLGNTAPIEASGFIAQTGPVNGSSAYLTLNASGINANPSAGGVNLPILSWNGITGSNNRISLNNISTINGATVGQGITTYATLTGQNITNSGVIASPSVVGVSSLNGVSIASFANSQLWVPYVVSNTASQSVTFSPNIPSQVLAFTALPITAAINGAVNISVTISVTPTTPAVSAINMILTAYIGGSVSGGTGITASVSFAAGTAVGKTVTLSGVCIVNGNQNSLIITATSDATCVYTFVQGSGVFRDFFFQQIL